MPSIPAPRASRLTIPCRLSHLAPAAAFIRAVAQAFGFEDKDAALLALATEEAVNNVITHGYGGECDEQVLLEIVEEPGQLRIDLTDQGIPFDPGTVPDYSPENPDLPGLGTHLIRRAVDELEFEILGREGRRTRMVKRLPQGRVDRQPGAALGERGAGKDLTPAPTGATPSFTVRAPRPDEALAISRLAWSAYGYGYEEYIYHPERINAAIAAGHLLSQVAISEPDGDLMGHLALKYSEPNAPLPEMGVAFVNPRYRRSGVFRDLNDACIRTAQKHGAEGFFVQAVTSHTASQSMAGSIGLAPTALNLGILPAGIIFKGLGSAGQKESALTLTRLFRPSPRVLHLPPRHRSMVETIFNWQGITCQQPDQAPTAPATPRGRLHGLVLPGGLNSAVIEVLEYGADTILEIARLAASWGKEGVDGVYLSLPLDEPATAMICERCEALGFFFAGATPLGLHGRDCLHLQMLCGIELDPGRLQLADERALELRDYVQRERARAAGA
ncbi:MAG: ATP-binding protein [Proteobacteria bacterium]|nr:ATP-binding protein [Pseudomonadota bacterium]